MALESLFEKVEDCGKTSIELLKLQAIDKTVDIIGTIAIKLTFFIVLATFITMLNFGIALWIGELLQKTYYGFFVMAGFYGIIALLFRSYLYQWVQVPVSNFIISKMLNDKPFEAKT